MKKIVRGNDFTLRIPVRKIVNGEKEIFPLPACEEIEVNLVNAFRRRRMAHTIGVEDDSLLEVSVHSSEMALGAYALEVKGKLFGRSWRSNEYEQIMLVDNNASGDTEFGETDEGEDSVEMDTAIVVLAPVTVVDGNFEVLIDKAVSESEKKTDTKLEELKNEIANGVRDGNWLPLKRGRKSDGTFVDDCVAMGYLSEATGYGSTAMGYNCKASGNTAHAENAGCTASGDNSHAEGNECTASGKNSHAEGENCVAEGKDSHAEGSICKTIGEYSHAEGFRTTASGDYSHAEGFWTETKGESSHAEGGFCTARGKWSHAQGFCNYDDPSFIDMVGIGSYYTVKTRKNASVIYVGRDSDGGINVSAPKNGYLYLLDVGDYKGEMVTEGMKSVQEVIADLTSRIEALEAKLADTTAEEVQQTN